MRSKILELVSPAKKIFIGYSGGVDSHVLLHLLHDVYRHKKGIELTAVHVDHNFSPKAKKWARHCQKICKQLSIKCITRTIAARINDSYSPEEILRKLRYEVFAKILPKEACLVTAHQADDQAETLLLQLFRGAGPKGLAAMPEKAKFAHGWLVRPLLGCSRKEIHLYATKHKLKWVEDESNSNTKYDRNLIRHQLLPSIKARWPAIITTLNRVSRHSAEASELLEILAEQDLARLVNGTDSSILNITLLKTLPLNRQKNVLRFWFHKLFLPTPAEVKLREIVRTVINSRYDATPVVKWFGAEVRRFRNNLYAMLPLMPFDKKKSIADLDNLRSKIARKFKLPMKKIRICFRQGGEQIKLPGRSGKHDLKKLMQEWSVPPWLRDRVPLIYYAKKIIAIVGYYNYTL